MKAAIIVFFLLFLGIYFFPVSKNALLPPCYEISQPFHHRFMPNCKGGMRYDGREISYSINEHSLRDRSFVGITKNPVLVLGDSIVEGWGLSQEETLSSQLEKLHAEKQFINAGIRSNGPIMEAFRADKLLEIYKPSSILWVLTENDVSDDLLSLALAHETDSMGRPLAFQLDDFHYLPWNWLAGFIPSLKGFFYLQTVEYLINKQETKNKSNACLGIDWLLSKADKIPVQYVIAALGSDAIDPLAKRGVDKILSCLPPKKVLDLRKTLKISAADYLPKDTHFSASGTEKVAKEILRSLKF